MDIDEWRHERLQGIEDVKSANEEWKKELKKGVRSWRDSVRYRVRNLKSRTEEQIADIKQQANKGEKSDGDKDTGRESEHAEDLLGNSDRLDNEAKADDSS